MIESKNLNSTSNSPARGGFTLIELLIVIAIIAILAAMLMPVLAKAQARAQEVGCLNNMRQWGSANSMYVDDNNQVYPWPRLQTAVGQIQDNPTWHNIQNFALPTTGQGDNIWFNGLPAYVANKPLYYWAANPVNFIHTKTIFLCPTAEAKGINPNDATSTAPEDMIPADRPLFNYAMNSKSLANQASTAILKSQMVAHPSYFVAFCDVRYRSDELPYYGSTSTDIATPHAYTTRFSSRHNQGSNLTFGDGHAAYYKYKYVVANGAVNPAIAAGHDPGNWDINWDCDGKIVP